MTRVSKQISPSQAAALLRDGDTVGLMGGGGGLMEASCLFDAIEKRFLETGAPRNLNLVHALGIGDKGAMGLNRFAHEGMVRRVIGGHWVWSPRMQELARAEKIEAYVLPGGVTSQLFREIGAGRPGLFTHVGLGTFVDPRLQGGRMNNRARDAIVEHVRLDGRDLLRYLPFPVHVALIRGSFADEDGNIAMTEEAADLDARALALAAHNSGGRVIAQVRRIVARGSLPARSVHIPGCLVDAVVEEEAQRLSYGIVRDPTMSGELHGPAEELSMPEPGVRRIVASRAADELRTGAVINFGFGIPDSVARIVAARGQTRDYWQTIEHGIHGGTLLEGTLFGYARNMDAIVDAPTQFDFYSGGGLDIAFLGFGEIDAAGNVNVSHLGGLPVGPGGFIDIAQNARKVVFCGTFDAKGARIGAAGGKLGIARHGDVCKLVGAVGQITFSGAQARRQKQDVIYVTERAVFRLHADGLVLSEVAPGIDLRRDVLDRMEFTPLMPEPPRLMEAAHFLT